MEKNATKVAGAVQAVLTAALKKPAHQAEALKAAAAILEALSKARSL